MPPFSFFQLWLARNWSARLVANEESFQHVASSDSSGTARKTTSKNIEGKCGEGKRKTGSCGHTQQKLLPPTYWPPACGFQLSTIENERVERLNSFQNWWKRLRRPLRHGFLLFMQSFRSSRGHFTWEKYCSVLFLRDFNSVTRGRSLTVAMSHLSSASETFSVNLSKLTDQMVYQILLYGNYLLSILTTGVFSLLSPRFYPQFLFAAFALCPSYSAQQGLHNWLGHEDMEGLYSWGSILRISISPFSNFPLFTLFETAPPPSPKHKCSWD